MRFLLPTLALIAAACSPGATPATTTATPVTPGRTAPPPGEAASAIRVFDGDSMIVALEDGTDVEVRLLGINAPEESECFGEASRDALIDRLGTDRLTLVRGAADVDRFGRLLRYIYIGPVNINEELVREGYALALQVDHRLEDRFEELGDAAATRRQGMWSPTACGPAPPTAVAVTDFAFDPRGRDRDKLNGEWITISNSSGAGLDTGGWILRDESSRNRFRFPVGFTLNDAVTVFTGCGPDTATELHWCADGPVWSNRGDTIILQDASGNVVARERYRG